MKTLIIANPTSGSFRRDLLEICSDRLRKKYGPVAVEYTTKPMDAASIASESDAGLIIAAGGDGLINETASGVIGQDKLFAALPFGTVNVFCREHKIPLDPVKAVDKLNLDNTKQISVGFLDNRPFLLMCGFGYDAKVVHSVTGQKKIFNKTINHLQEGIKSIACPYPELYVYANNRKYKAYHVIASLAQRYAGGFRLSKNIKPHILNVFIQQDNKPNSLFFSVMSIAMGWGFPKDPVYATELKVEGTSFAQIDGEFIDTLTIHNYIKIKQDSITIAL